MNPGTDRRQHSRGIPSARLRGEINLSTPGSLRDARLDAVPETAVGLVVDLSETTYLDSTGVELFLQLERRLRVDERQLRVVAPEATPITRVLTPARLGHRCPAARDR